MSPLAIYSESAQGEPEAIKDHVLIATQLKNIGVKFEQWQASQPLAADADQAAVTAAYQTAIDTLNAQYGFQSVDIVALRPDTPDKANFRKKFLAEHTHADFEVRFIVEHGGLFYLHVGDKVYLLLCEKADLISVAANTTLCFDLGESQNFKCIRLLTTADGRVGGGYRQ